MLKDKAPQVSGIMRKGGWRAERVSSIDGSTALDERVGWGGVITLHTLFALECCKRTGANEGVWCFPRVHVLGVAIPAH
eukprot:5878140-Prymnesium_polylepis.4